MKKKEEEQTAKQVLAFGLQLLVCFVFALQDSQLLNPISEFLEIIRQNLRQEKGTFAYVSVVAFVARMTLLAGVGRRRNLQRNEKNQYVCNLGGGQSRGYWERQSNDRVLRRCAQVAAWR
jgi:hypothetical protein